MICQEKMQEIENFWFGKKNKDFYTVFHKKELRRKSLSNSKMSYLNVQLLGLNGRVHLALLDINTTQDAKKLRPHLKFLSGDFLSGEMLAADRPSLSPARKLCSAPVDSYDYILRPKLTSRTNRKYSRFCVLYLCNVRKKQYIVSIDCRVEILLICNIYDIYNTYV